MIIYDKWVIEKEIDANRKWRDIIEEYRNEMAWE
jgi:hypothetical protein